MCYHCFYNFRGKRKRMCKKAWFSFFCLLLLQMADPLLGLTLGRMFTSHMVLQAEPQVSINPFQFNYLEILGKDFLFKAVSLFGGRRHLCLAGHQPWLERCSFETTLQQKIRLTKKLSLKGAGGGLLWIRIHHLLLHPLLRLTFDNHRDEIILSKIDKQLVSCPRAVPLPASIDRPTWRFPIQSNPVHL